MRSIRFAAKALARTTLGIAWVSATASFANSPTVPDPTVARADYANPALWLCRPDLSVNRCDVNLDATVIAADGTTTVERHVPVQDAGFDCFFVYPTVSRDPGWQSDFVPDATEIDDIKQQFARFGRVCRQFAPMYRQNTLTALRRNAGGPQPVGEKLPEGIGGFTDVRDAWTWYLKNANGGRGVVLIGHSQGAAMIARLLAEEVDGKPIQKQLISALAIGGPVYAPAGKDVGGSFKTIPLCRAKGQVGCVIAYATFRDNYPPPANSLFGKTRDGMRYACTNPTNLAGGEGVGDAYFVTKGFLNDAGGKVQPDWTNPPQPIATPFVKTPGLVSTRCIRSGEFDYLALHLNPTPGGKRTNTIAGEIVRPFGVDYSWGLHILDMDHSLGNLVETVGAQGRAWLAGKRGN